ncbi:MAG: tetratricopeptide repeat protein [Microcoleaceae cyanobacterium]
MKNLSENLLKNLLQNFTNCATVAQSLINQADQGNKELTIIFYQRAIALYPYNLKIHQQLKNLNISPTNYQPEKSQEYFQLGNQYSENQEIFETIVAYETAITFNWQNARAYQKLGEILINLEQWQTASHVLEVAIWFNPNFPWNYQKLGEAYSHLEQWSQAKQAYQQTIKLIPDFPWAYHKLAKIQTQLGEISEAIINHQQVIKLKSDAWESWEKLIQLLIQMERYEEAIAHCQELQKINPQAGWSWGLLGDIYRQQKAYTKAIEVYQTVIKLKPDYVWGYLKLADLLSSQGDLPEAINYYQQVLKYQPNNTEIYRKIGQYYQQLGNTEQAIIIYNKLIEKEPHHWQNYHQLGEIFISQKQINEAINIYHQAIEANVESWKIYVTLGNILIENNDPEQAINCYLQAISIRPYDENSYSHLRGVFNYKLIKLSSQVLEKLIDAYKNIIDSYPQATDAHINLANILAESGQLPAAIKHYKQALHHKLAKDYPNLLVTNQSGQAKPNFLIIGTPKGGTTALYGYLSSHPKIVPALHKEISFFDTKFHLGLDWYGAHFPNLSAHENQHNNLLTGEATPNYMYSQVVCQRIYDCLPEVKLIVVLRNPIDRGISHYYMAKKIGIEKRDLTTVINQEIQVLKKLPQNLDNLKNLATVSNQLKTGKNYFQSGLYIYFLVRWLEKFSNQILILSNEEMSKNPDQVMADTYEFLGLPHYSLIEYKKYFTGKYHNEMTKQQRDNLSELFYPHNTLLEEYLGRKFNWI